jgi:hypothetical protein
LDEDKVRIEQIHIGPITTPDCPDPTESPRYIREDDGFYGFDTVSLEDATWNALCEIVRERGCTVDELCSDIELNFAPANRLRQPRAVTWCATSPGLPTISSCPAAFAFSRTYSPPTGASND